MEGNENEATASPINLHYLNLNPDPGSDSSSLQFSAFNNFKEIQKFLYNAKKRVEETQTLQIEWREPIKRDAQNGQSGTIESAIIGTWIELVIPEGDDEEKYESFFTEPVLSDKQKAGRGDIEVLDVVRENDLLLVSRIPAGKFLFIHPNTWTLHRQLIAVDNLLRNPHPEHRPLIRLAYYERYVQWSSFAPIMPTKWQILDDRSFTGVEHEKEFVSKALGTPDFAILEGPPGSGKTVTICELILQEIALGHRVLLCASTHVAVDNVLERLVKDGWTKKNVIAIRIGREGDVTSDDVLPLILEKRVQTETRELIHSLRNTKARSASQEYLLNALQEDGQNIISKMVLDIANLVCGTTIGILQHPDIKKGLYKPALPKYDILIIDEASKTTFQEFLVPALYARKWILVGDVRQLSPYVEEDTLLGNLVGLIDENTAKAVLVPFLTWWQDRYRRKNGSYLYCDSEPAVRRMILQQTEILGIPSVEITPELDAEPSLPLLTSKLFITDSDRLDGVSHLVPPDCENLIGTQDTPRLVRRKEYWRSHNPKYFQKFRRSDDSDNRWETAIFWRLVRQFELRRRPEEAKKWDEAVQKLLPLWKRIVKSPDGREWDLNELVRKDLERIRRIAFPSVLELLQVGFQSDIKQASRCAISHGMPPDALKERHSILRYQHRMHPDISRFPREHIYDEECLMDPNDILNRPEWRGELYKNRRIWIDINGEMIPYRKNPSEAECIDRELSRFIDWAHRNPKRNGQAWEVALLTFYTGQLFEIRHWTQKQFKQNHKWNFFSADGNIHVRLGTVDRFQGHEADIVFLSFVRDGGVGFLDCPNRLNVAITRARHQLVIVGNRQVFLNQDKSELLRQLADETPYEVHFKAPIGKGGSG